MADQIENSAERLRTARALAIKLGASAVPGSINSVLRLLVQQHTKGQSALSAGVMQPLMRLVKVPAFQAPLYFAAKLFKPQFIGSSERFDAASLAKAFDPYELAAIFGVVYYERRAKHIADADEWKHITEIVQRQSNLGAFVGQSIPEIGFSLGLVVGGLPSLAFTAFQVADMAGFKEYRRHLKSKNLALDPKFELQKFGCTAVEVAALLAQSLGFGINVAEAFSNLGSSKGQVKEDSRAEAGKLRAAFAWILSLGTSETDEFASMAETVGALDEMLKKCALAREGGDDYRWINRGKADLTPESAPKLFSMDKASSAAENGNSADSPEEPIAYSSLSDEIKAFISEEDFKTMSQDEIKQLIREMAPKEIS